MNQPWGGTNLQITPVNWFLSAISSQLTRIDSYAGPHNTLVNGAVEFLEENVIRNTSIIRLVSLVRLVRNCRVDHDNCKDVLARIL
jgi:hypothetical protein